MAGACLLVDVLFCFETFNKWLDHRLVLVGSSRHGEFHLFYCAIEIALCRCDPRLLVVSEPMVGILFHVEAENLEGLILLSFSLQLTSIGVQLHCVGKAQSFFSDRGGIVLSI